MNEIVKQPVTAEVPEASQLITLKPEKYVAEVFAPFKKSLAKAIKEASVVEYNIRTKEGMEVAKNHRRVFLKLRTAADAAKKERKAPITAIAKLLDTKFNELVAEITPHENKFDADITAEETRIAEEKARKEAEERARVEAIENRIANIRNIPMRCMNSNSADIVATIENWSAFVLDPADYQEYLEDAINAVNATLVELEKVRASAVAREAAEAKAEAERLELLRLREESEKRDREAAEQRKQEEERQRQAREKHEAEMKAMRDEMAQQKAEMDRQRAQIEQERAALEAQKNPPATLFASAEGRIQQSAPQVVDADFLEVASAPAGLEVIPESEWLYDRRIPVVGTRDQVILDILDGAEEKRERPTLTEIIGTLATAYGVSNETVAEWLRDLLGIVLEADDVVV